MNHRSDRRRREGTSWRTFVWTDAWIGSIDISYEEGLHVPAPLTLKRRELAKHSQSGGEVLRHSCFIKQRQNHDFLLAAFR